MRIFEILFYIHVDDSHIYISALTLNNEEKYELSYLWGDAKVMQWTSTHCQFWEK